MECLLLKEYYKIVFVITIFLAPVSLSLSLSQFLFIYWGCFFPPSLKNATAVFHVALFTLNLQFALHILQPRPRRHAGLRDKSHSPKKKGREKKMERGAKSLTLHSNAIIAAFDAGGRLCRPFVVWASSPLGRPVVLLRT